MKRMSEEQIMEAVRPSDIFTMDERVIEQEKEEYLSRFKPEAYHAVRNFVVTQKVILLYRKAISELQDGSVFSDLMLDIKSTEGQEYHFECQYAYDIKIGKMYVAEENIIFVVAKDKRKYFENYIAKTNNYPHFDKNVWQSVRYMLPEVSRHFQVSDGTYAIILKKPCKMYPMREILNYFHGSLRPEYVASMLNRLYNFECYLDLCGMTHNGLTIDNLFFAPGKTVEEGDSYTVDDMRIVGVYGGWFYTTYSHESISGMPVEVYEILPAKIKASGYSTFEVDELSIKRIARELLGDATGKTLNVPDNLRVWLNTDEVEQNAYLEFARWEKVNKNAFGEPRFVEMDVSID